MSNQQSVGDILDKLEELADSDDEVSVDDVVQAFGSRTYGPILLAPAILGVSPIGGTPGVPTFLAAIVFLFAIQIVLGRKHLWLPGVLKKRAVSSDKLSKAVGKLRSTGERLDSWFGGRIEALTTGPAARIAAGVVSVLCLAIPPLELLPFAVILPMAVVAAFGLALTVRDGLLMLLAFGGSAVAIYLAIANVLLGGGSGG